MKVRIDTWTCADCRTLHITEWTRPHAYFVPGGSVQSQTSDWVRVPEGLVRNYNIANDALTQASREINQYLMGVERVELSEETKAKLVTEFTDPDEMFGPWELPPDDRH